MADFAAPKKTDNVFTFSDTFSAALAKDGELDIIFHDKKTKSFSRDFNWDKVKLIEAAGMLKYETTSSSTAPAAKVAKIKPLLPEGAYTLIGGVKPLNRYVYDSDEPFFQRFVVPPHIKEFCTLALETYNREKGTNYRYVCPRSAHEGGQTRDTIHTMIFKASRSNFDTDSETFIAKFKSGFRYPQGKMSYFREIQKVSRLGSA